MQAQSYAKDSLLDSMCPPSATPAPLGSEQEFQMLPKSRLNTVSVNYCSVSQDFPGGNLNLLTNSSGKRTFWNKVVGLSWKPFRMRDAWSGHPVLCHWSRRLKDGVAFHVTFQKAQPV